MHIKTLFTFFLLTNFIFLQGQDYAWERTIYDSSGQPLFTGGYLSRSLVNFVDIDGDEDEDIFFLAGNDYDFYYLHFFKNTGTNKNPKYNFVTDKYSPYNYYYGYYSRQYPPMTTFADIDADEDYDLFIAYGEDLRLYINTGNKTNPVFDWDNFEIILTINTDLCNYPAFIDIDSDNDLDLFITDIGNVYFYRNTGTPTNYNFELENDDLIPYYTPNGNLAFCDIDDDADYDLFYNVSNPNNIFKYCKFENIGDSANFNFQLTDDQYFVFNYWEESYLKWTAACDYANDNDVDFFIGFIAGPVYYNENIGAANLAQWEEPYKNFLDIDVRSVSYAKLIDIDNDNDLDLFTTGDHGDLIPGESEGSSIWYFENTGDINEPVFQYRSACYDSLKEILQFSFVDIDADGDYDLFTGNSDYENTIRFYENTGGQASASFILKDSAVVNIAGSGANCPSPLFADIDNDGDFDMLVSERETIDPGEPAFNLIRNTGDKYNPQWDYESDDYFGLPLGVYDVWDYDNDGDLDLIVGANYYTNGQTQIFENTGTKEAPDFNYKCNIDSLSLDPFIYGHGTIAFADIDNNSYKDAFIGQNNGGIFYYKNHGPVSNIEHNNKIPQNFYVCQNYPNPFNPKTVISYHLSNISNVELNIYNTLGQKIKTLIKETKPAGRHSIVFDAEGLTSGVYFYRLSAATAKGQKEVFSKIFKMVYLK